MNVHEKCHLKIHSSMLATEQRLKFIDFSIKRQCENSRIFDQIDERLQITSIRQ